MFGRRCLTQDVMVPTLGAPIAVASYQRNGECNDRGDLSAAAHSARTSTARASVANDANAAEFDPIRKELKVAAYEGLTNTADRAVASLPNRGFGSRTLRMTDASVRPS